MKSKMLRPLVDIFMTVLLLLSMSYELIGPAFAAFSEKVLGFSFDGYELGPIFHEIVGGLLVIIFFWHLWLNRWWLKNLFKGKYNASRFFLTLVNFLIIADVFILLVSGIFMSRIISLPFEEGMDYARAGHVVVSYWGYIFMSFHAGMNWNIFSAMMFSRRPKKNSVMPQVIAVALMLWGVSAFQRRSIAEYLFMNSQFVFFDFEEPIIFFLLDYLAIFILFACAGNYFMKALRSFERA